MKFSSLNLLNSIFLALFTAVLFVMPFLFAFNAANIDSHQRILVNTFFWIIATGALFILQGKIRHAALGIISVLAGIPNIIVMTYLIMDHTIFKSSDFWCVFDTNVDEATGFFTTVPLKAFIWCLVYIVLLVVLLRAYLKTYNKIRFIRFLRWWHRVTLAA